MSVTLYRKYRPQIFADVIGQKHIVQTLTNALKLGRIGQAYLLTGPRGTGKTTLARLFAKAVNCSDRNSSTKAQSSFAGAEPCGKCPHCLLMAEGRSLDVIEIDAASHTGVDNIRELRETVALPPTLGSHKVYIIDEVHMLSIGAFNALLKTLEEPPAHVIFILATTALHKVPDTIVSRCQRFDLSRFPVRSIVEKLATIAKKEKMKIDQGALEMIALAAEGGMRDAESLLTQIASLEGQTITEEKVIEVLGTTKKENIAALLSLIGKGELYQSLAFVRQLSQDGADLSVFSGALLHYLRDLLLVSADPANGPAELDLTDTELAKLSELAKTFSPDRIVRMLEHFQTAQVASKTAVIPELPLEIAIVKILSVNLPTGQASRQQPTGNDPSSPAPLSKGSSGVRDGEGLETPKKSETKTVHPVKSSAAGPPEAEFHRASDQQSPASEITHPSSDITHQSPNIDLSAVQSSWQAILDTAKRLNASLTLALSTARPVDIEGATIVIAVKYPFHKERLDEPANRLTLKTAFDTILGSRTSLRVVLENSSASSSKADETKEANEAFTLNPLVNQAMEMLGGKIIGTENS